MSDHAPPIATHSVFDDVQALVTGVLFVGMGLSLFRQAGLLSGGTAGIAFVLHYALRVPLGAAFFALNLPFYWLAWRRMGLRFTVKTFAAVALLSTVIELLPRLWVLRSVNPWFAALGGGLLTGAGFVILFRHHASLGGINVVVSWLQEAYGFRAGKVQMMLDITILLAALPWVHPSRLALSVVGAIAMNFALAVNHRPGRYLAM
jgi:uncharacterized membrane-anchored protein YitT (DUF2179 family)